MTAIASVFNLMRDIGFRLQEGAGLSPEMMNATNEVIVAAYRARHGLNFASRVELAVHLAAHRRNVSHLGLDTDPTQRLITILLRNPAVASEYLNFEVFAFIWGEIGADLL